MSLEISDLGLTPRQYTEVQEADPQLVEVWLEAVSRDGVSNPAAWFLTGLRSGAGPEQRYDSERGRLIHLAERWIENVGLLYDREDDVVDELFGDRGLLRHYAGDAQLQTRLTALWRQHRPRGEQTEREQVERAERNAKTYFALKRRQADELGADQG